MTTPMDKLDSLGARIDALKSENQAGIEQIREQTRLISIKYIRLPLFFGTINTGLTIGGDTEQTAAPPTPDQGYVWHIRHLVIEGLTASATTPDVINILRQGRIVWQLNGNQFAQTWGRGEMRLVSGEVFAYAAVGTITGGPKTIIVHGLAEEVAAEQEGKFR